MTSSKRPRVEADEDSDDDMLFGNSSSSLSSSAPTEDPEQPLKRLHLDDKSASASSVSEETIHCLLPGHAELSLPTYNAYEIHYEQYHLHRCNECHKNFPSDHYLQLHISENHDPIIAVRRERGERTVRQAHSSSLILLQILIITSTDVSLKGAIGNALQHRSDECI
jgi:hypothetical protein